MPHPLASPPTHQSHLSLSMPSLYPWVQAPTNEPGSAPKSNIHCSGTFNHRLYLQHAPPHLFLHPPIIGFAYTTPRPRRATPTSLQTPPLSEHQGEAGLMTAPAVLKWWGAGLLRRCPGNGRGKRELRQREGSGRALSGTAAARGPCPAPPATPPPAHLPPCPHP